MRSVLVGMRTFSFVVFAATMAVVGPSRLQAMFFNSEVIWEDDCLAGSECSGEQEDQCDSDCQEWCQNEPTCGELGVTSCDACGDPCTARCICYYTPVGD